MSNSTADDTSFGDVVRICSEWMIGVSNGTAIFLTRRCIGIDNFRSYQWQPVTKPFPELLQRWFFPIACLLFIWAFAYMMPKEWLKHSFIWLGWFVVGRAYLILIVWEFSDKTSASVPSTSLGFNSLLPYFILNEDNPNTFVRYSNLIEPVLYGLFTVVFWKLHVAVVALFFACLCIGLTTKIISIREIITLRDVDVRNKYLVDTLFQGRLNRDNRKDDSVPDQDAPVM